MAANLTIRMFAYGRAGEILNEIEKKRREILKLTVQLNRCLKHVATLEEYEGQVYPAWDYGPEQGNQSDKR